MRPLSLTLKNKLNTNKVFIHVWLNTGSWQLQMESKHKEMYAKLHFNPK